jgi:outer membrane protein OmpA-like peptidoglycan-associated protein
MGDVYIPGIWSQRYQQLPQAERTAVDQETNRRFSERTRITRKLDPAKDHDLVVKWLRSRDQVMAQMAGKGRRDWRKSGTGLVLGLPAPMNNWAMILLYNYDVGDHNPKPEHLTALKGAVTPLMRAGLDMIIGVEGHASRTGGEELNQPLSDRRAAEVDAYLRKLPKGTSKVTFLKPGGFGKRQQVSQNPTYKDAWPKLASVDEDERDRSVIVTIAWQQVGTIDAINAQAVDWDKAFDQAARRAALLYALGRFTAITGDNVSPVIKGVPSPWNPWTGWPSSWTSGNPDADAVMKAITPEILSDIDLAIRRNKLNISRDEIQRRYEEWLKSPNNKWVK